MLGLVGFVNNMPDAILQLSESILKITLTACAVLGNYYVSAEVLLNSSGSVANLFTAYCSKAHLSKPNNHPAPDASNYRKRL
jgi:hypothetical protein